MTTYKSIPLTPDQQASMRSGSDWLMLTAEQLALIKSTGPGETCMFFGNELIKLSNARLEAIQKVAFDEAAIKALQELGPSDDADVKFEVGDIALGQTFLRVTASDASGASATAVGTVPHPRTH